MAWVKQGLIFLPQAERPYLNSHASNPLPKHLEKNTFRVFYNGRDKHNRSSISYFDFDIDAIEVKSSKREVVCAYGEEDSCTSHGISNGCFLERDENIAILCMGWQIRGVEHWRGDIVSIELNKTFDLGFSDPLPFLANDNITDSISLSYPFILMDEGVYKMWYGSTISWDSPNGEMVHVLKYATSSDGKNWTRHGVAVPYEIGVAQAFSRPTLLKDGSGYHMWFSYRGGNGVPYRIGYATSFNGVDWELKLDESGIDVSDSGWDSEMICYPYVFEHKGQRYMLYNGNDHGRTGIGLAIWE